MDSDGFRAGVSPGGLYNKDDIKLLICYIFANINNGISKGDIIEIFQKNSLANYFEVNTAFSDLIENGHIKCAEEKENYYITESGKLISEQLDVDLPISIRDKAISSALNIIAQIRRETENTATIKKVENGYNVICSVSGGATNLMSICVYVPDLMQANLVKKNFHENPEIFYRCIIALATKNRDTVKEILDTYFN